MKRIILVLALVSVTMGKAQDLNDIFVAGVADAERFANAYLAPVSRHPSTVFPMDGTIPPKPNLWGDLKFP